MIEDESPADSAALPTQELVAQSILSRFPGAALARHEKERDAIFEISFEEKLLLRLDGRGARYFFPSRRKRTVKWEKITVVGLPRVIDYILRDLAEANYEVISTTNTQILKRPIHVSRHMGCPECKEGGGIKILVRGETLAAENSEIYTTITPDTDVVGAEIKCTLCGWIGIRSLLLRKMRRSRKAINHEQR